MPPCKCNPFPSVPLPDRHALAGPCVRCAHYILSIGKYTAECHGCSRFYGDQFTERVPESADSIHIPATCTKNG